MSMNSGTRLRVTPRWWWTPAAGVAGGLAYLIAGWVGGDLTFGLGGLAVMLVASAAFVILRRISETVAGLLDRRDERINRIDTDATSFAGMVLILAVIVGMVVEIARGQDGMPYAALGCLAGVAYVAALVFLLIRR